jgi:flagellar basal body-associated protein FliL
MEPPMSKNIRTLYFLLLSTATLLILILITGTIFALGRHLDADALIKLGKTRTKQSAIVEIQESDIRIFSGLGRLRISLVNSSVLILSIAFPYQADDIPFTEELAAKLGDLKNIATDYFSSFSIDQINFLDEKIAKAEILKLYNANRRLGHIEALYFTDMIIIDADN